MLSLRHRKRQLLSYKLNGRDIDRFGLVNDALDDIDWRNRRFTYLLTAFFVLLGFVGYYTNFYLDWFLYVGLGTSLVLSILSCFTRIGIGKAISQLRQWYHDPRKEFAQVFDVLAEDKTFRKYEKRIVEKNRL